jgi:3-oxoacyl-[acyl-carrier-protein] synthase-3
MATHVLCITSETYSKHLHPKDRSNRAIFGDGAAATLLTASEEEKIFDFVFGTDGSGYQNLIVPNGGFRHKHVEFAEEKEEPEGSFRTDNHLYMNGPEIFNFTIEKVPVVVEMVLKRNGLSLEDIDYVIFHQANQYMLNHLRKITHIPKDKFYIHLENTGNTVSATIPIALKDCLDRGMVTAGDKVLLVGFGVGYSWGATIIEI